MNRQRCTVLALVAALTGFGIGIAADRSFADTHYVAKVPLYGAGAAQPVGAEPVAEGQPDWAKRMEAKVDKLLKLLEELDDKTPDPMTGASAGEELFFRADLTAADRARIVRKVKATGEARMPPPDAPQLTDAEKATMVAAFSGQQADPATLGTAGAKCMGCHQPTSAAKKGGEFVLFQTKAQSK